MKTLRHIAIKLPKIKDKHKILKAIREKRQITYKRNPMRLSADFSTEALQAQKEWHDVFHVMKGKNLQPRTLYPAKLSIRFNGEIKSLTDKQELREFSTTHSSTLAWKIPWMEGPGGLQSMESLGVGHD